ncbi:MAG: complex I NDUFA9 subunit family protein [Anaerolineales bacterium]|nr:complex I NDUFA9 subunit family protein [Anaerolineales bacterium]
MILVTGASGYIGSHLVKRLTQIDKPIRAMVRRRSQAEKEGRLAGLSIEWVEADVSKSETLAVALDGVDVVIHTVAIAIEKGRHSYEEVNFVGTKNLVDACIAKGVKRFINLSQLGADAELPYRFLASKGRAQDYVATSGLQWTAFRPSVVWGPEDEFANTFARLVPLSPLIYPIVDKDARFQPIWVEDLVTAMVKSIDDAATIGEQYELGGPEVLTLEEIERRTLKAIGARRLFVPIPRPILRLIVALMEILLPNPPVTRSLLELLAVDNVPAQNEIQRFVDEPLAFTPENTSGYMRQFRLSQTLAQFFGK